MAFEVQGQVGPIIAQDGSHPDFRQGRLGGLAVFDLHGRYYEQSQRSNLFIATTATAGIAPGTALSASPALAVANPLNSGRNVAVLRARLQWVSGTFGAGAMYWAQGVNPSSLPAETSAALRAGGLLNGANSGDIAKAYSGVSLTNTPTVLRPSAFSLGTYAGASTTMLPPQSEEIDGEFVIPPGSFIALHGIAGAGTSPVVTLSITYELVNQ